MKRAHRIADPEPTKQAVVEAPRNCSETARFSVLLAEASPEDEAGDVAEVAPPDVDDVEVVIEHVACFVVVLPRWHVTYLSDGVVVHDGFFDDAALKARLGD